MSVLYGHLAGREANKENFTLLCLLKKHVSVKKLYVSLRVFLWCPCHVFEADTGEAVVLMKVNQPFKTCNNFIVRKSQAGNVEAQHP